MIKTIKEWLHRINDYPKLKATYEDSVKMFGDLSNDLDLCETKIYNMTKEKELEHYWNTKRKQVNRQWRCRDGVLMDLRAFFQKNCNLPIFTGTIDEKAKKALGYVISTVRYQSDGGEFWQYAYETILSCTGDCEDMGILVANILWNNGVPYWRIRLNKGWVEYKGGKDYHAWCTYLAENGEWYVLDAAYWPRESAGLKLKWKDAEKYLSVDASWNFRYSFGGQSK